MIKIWKKLFQNHEVLLIDLKKWFAFQSGGLLRRLDTSSGISSWRFAMGTTSQKSNHSRTEHRGASYVMEFEESRH